MVHRAWRMVQKRPPAPGVTSLLPEKTIVMRQPGGEMIHHSPKITPSATVKPVSFHNRFELSTNEA